MTKIKRKLLSFYCCYYCEKQIYDSDDVGAYHVFKDNKKHEIAICKNEECLEKELGPKPSGFGVSIANIFFDIGNFIEKIFKT